MNHHLLSISSVFFSTSLHSIENGSHTRFLVKKISHWSYLNRSNSIRFRINHKRKQLSNQLILPAERDYKWTNQCVQFERMKEKKNTRARARFSSLLSFFVIALYFFPFSLTIDRKSVGRFIAQHTPSLLPLLHFWHMAGIRNNTSGANRVAYAMGHCTQL